MYPLVSFRKSCSVDLESCSPSPLLTKSDILRFGPYVIDKIFGDTVHIRLSLSHYVDVFQWDQECFIICIVETSNELLHEVDE